MAGGRTTNILYLLTLYLLYTYLLTGTCWLALTNSNTLNLMMLWCLMQGCMGQRFCNAAVWIAELLRVKKVAN